MLRLAARRAIVVAARGAALWVLAGAAAVAETPDVRPVEGSRGDWLGRVTLGELLATWAAHDLGHLGQIARVMAKRYHAAVGAWQAYLPVLGDRVTDPEGC